MGVTWEVSAWGQHSLPYNDRYFNGVIYSGNSLLAALRVFWRNRHKYSCVSINYRGMK